MGETVDGFVDPVRREDTARNHTATHMLHAALRQVLGPHVRQAGSLVAPDRLRFDFTHVQQVTDEEMWQVQLLVNEKVRQNARVLKDEDTYQEAIRRGALAFFGDRYDERVRLVEIANGDTFSFEVCGGTHVGRTGEVGAVYVLGESSIGAGMRRIEAISGRAAERLVWDRFNRDKRVGSKLVTAIDDIEDRVQRLLDERDELQRENEALHRRISLQSADGLLDLAQDVDGVTVLAARATVSNADSLREIGDYLRDKLGSGVVVLGSVINDRPMLVAMVTSDLIDAKGPERRRGRARGGQGGRRRRRRQGRGRTGRRSGRGQAGRRAGPGTRAGPGDGGGVTILALDVGDRRIGLALSDPTGLLASPLGAVERGPSDVDDILRVVLDNGVTEIVVGLPLTLAGESGQQAGKVRRFVHELRSKTDLAVTAVDERLSTVQAQRMLRESGSGRRGRDRGRLDAAAAAVILQAYLDSRG